MVFCIQIQQGRDSNKFETVKTAKRAILLRRESPSAVGDEGERSKTPVKVSTAKPDYAVTAHGRARLEVTEMKAPATFTPVLI